MGSIFRRVGRWLRRIFWMAARLPLAVVLSAGLAGGAVKPIRPDHVAIYIRWSTDDQATGTTLEVQREACEYYLKSQGWQVREDMIFVDDGYSGGSLDRPGIRKLRQRVKRGDVDCVVVLKIDRLSRNIVDAVELVLREWKDLCHLKSAREPIDTQTDLGRMIFGILAMFADYERAQIRDRTQSGKEKKIKNGEQMHAKPGYGLMLHPTEKGKWIEHPEHANQVRRVFQWAHEGHSANQICRMLNAEGIPSPRGKQWSVRAVLWVLKNRAYIGEAIYGRTSLKPLDEREASLLEPVGTSAAASAGTLAARQPRKKRVRVQHETPKFQGKTDAVTPLVSEAVFEAVQDRLREKQWQRESMGSRGISSPYLLVGLAQCSCGGALVHKVQMGKRNRERGVEYRHYICHKSRQGVCTANGHIPAPAAEEIIETMFLNLYGIKDLREDRFVASLEAVDLERRALAGSLAEAERELKRLEEERLGLLRGARSGKVSLDDLRDLLESVDADKQVKLAQVQAVEARLGEVDVKQRALHATLSSLDATQRWNTLQPWEKRQLIRMVLTDRITISKPKGNHSVSVEIPWAF